MTQVATTATATANTTAYRYAGPPSGVTLVETVPDGSATERDVLLWHGQTAHLPADHPVVRTLVGQGFLVPEPVKQPQTKPAA